MRMFTVMTVLITAVVLGMSMSSAQPPQQAPLVSVKVFTPNSSVKIAAADLATIPESERPYIRYLSLYNIPKEKRKEYAAIVSFVCNSLSTRRQVYIPVFVGNSDETVIRINISHYEWKPESWDTLATKGSGPKAQPEPYFQTFVEKSFSKLEKKKVVKQVTREVTKYRTVIKGYYPNGQPYYANEPYTENVTEVVESEDNVPGEPVVKDKILVSAPWLDNNAMSYLTYYTQSTNPVLRADWFISYATIPPAYYNFLKLGDKIEDFHNLIFANEELAKKARSQDKAVIVTSMVARNNRTLTRSPTFTGGYYWASHDSLSSVDDRQYILNVLNEKFDATEDIGTLPNGLQAYFLTDGKGKRLDFANPDIAIDNSAVDRVVRTGRSCIVCHSMGIIPLDDEVRALTKKLQNKEQVKLYVTKKEDYYKIQDLFGTNIDEQIIKDQNLYIAAVARTNGLKAEVNGKLYANIWDAYYEKLLSKQEVANDLGVTLAELENYVKLSNDPIMLGMVKYPIRAIRRDQWERSYQGMMLIVATQKQNLVPVQPAFTIGPAVPVYISK